MTHEAEIKRIASYSTREQMKATYGELALISQILIELDRRLSALEPPPPVEQEWQDVTEESRDQLIAMGGGAIGTLLRLGSRNMKIIGQYDRARDTWPVEDYDYPTSFISVSDGWQFRRPVEKVEEPLTDKRIEELGANFGDGMPSPDEELFDHCCSGGYHWIVLQRRNGKWVSSHNSEPDAKAHAAALNAAVKEHVEQRVKNLARFKQITHMLLDHAGVPPFGKEECRVSHRISWLVQQAKRP